MTMFFAKTKRSGVICALAVPVMLAVAAIAVYFAVGNYLCALDAPVLLGESGGAVFIGYYLLTYAYSALALISVLLSLLFLLNAVKALKK